MAKRERERERKTYNEKEETNEWMNVFMCDSWHWILSVRTLSMQLDYIPYKNIIFYFEKQKNKN